MTRSSRHERGAHEGGVTITEMPAETLRRNCLTCEVKGPECFCHLPTDALTELQHIGRPLHLQRGERILYEDSSADHVYLVCAGQLKITASSADGKLLILRLAHSGDVLGLAAALHGSRHKVAAEALEPCEVKSIPREEFLRFASRFQTVSRNTALAATADYESAVLSARRLALSGSASAKLASLLVDFSEMNAGREFSMPLTHEELGSMAGLSRETVTRLLTRFRREGLIAHERGRITLLDLSALEALFQ